MARPSPRGRGRNAKDGKKPNRGGGLFRRRKFCRFTAEKIKEVDYKDIAILKDFINAVEIALWCLPGIGLALWWRALPEDPPEPPPRLPYQHLYERPRDPE